MLTRIEISGFKSFENFSLDLGPFTVILGPNASGKSNILDAVQAVSRAVTSDNLSAAFSAIRGAPDELFTRYADGRSGDQMFFAVEVLLDPNVTGSLGEQITLECTRLRYELNIQRLVNERGERIIVVTKEEVRPIIEQEDIWIRELNPSSEQFRERYVKYNCSRPLLTSISGYQGDSIAFVMYPDGRQEQEVRRQQKYAEAPMLASIKSSELPHLYALRQELAAYRFLQLNPRALREPSPATSREIGNDGSNLASALARIQAITATSDYPRGVLNDIATDLADLIPGIEDFEVELDQGNRYYIKVRANGGAFMDCATASDGTLRTMAVLAMLYDPDQQGLICLEEPENGINPLRLKQLVSRLRELVTNVADENIYEQNLLQMLLTSHSPVVLSSISVEEGETIFTEMAMSVRPLVSASSRKTIARRVLPKLPVGFGTRSQFTSKYQVNRYLSTIDWEVVVHD